MSNKITPQGSLPGAVTKEQLEALSANFFANLQIMDGNGYRPLSCSDPKDPTHNDTKSIYFDKARIDEFFAENPGSNGLKIYLGLNNSKIYPCEPYYENKMMVVLVTTTDEVDNLKKAGALTEGGGGEGLDQGKLCPPSPIC